MVVEKEWQQFRKSNSSSKRSTVDTMSVFDSLMLFLWLEMKRERFYYSSYWSSCNYNLLGAKGSYESPDGLTAVCRSDKVLCEISQNFSLLKSIEHDTAGKAVKKLFKFFEMCSECVSLSKLVS